MGKECGCFGKEQNHRSDQTCLLERWQWRSTGVKPRHMLRGARSTFLKGRREQHFEECGDW